MTLKTISLISFFLVASNLIADEWLIVPANNEYGASLENRGADIDYSCVANGEWSIGGPHCATPASGEGCGTYLHPNAYHPNALLSSLIYRVGGKYYYAGDQFKVYLRRNETVIFKINDARNSYFDNSGSLQIHCW